MNGVFIDSNIFIGILEGEENAKKVFNSDLKLYKNSLISSEVIYIYLKAVTNKKSYVLKKNPEEITRINLNKIEELLDLAETLPMNKEIEDLSFEIIKKYGLLPNDALIAATCKHYGIRNIATFDRDFERIDFLNVWKS
jgi:predicted nucleic acid-binding protein